MKHPLVLCSNRCGLSLTSIKKSASVRIKNYLKTREYKREQGNNIRKMSNEEKTGILRDLLNK